MIAISVEKRQLKFITPAGTSRGVLLNKPSWFLKIWHREMPSVVGVGEVSVIPGLHIESESETDERLNSLLKEINETGSLAGLELEQSPAIRFGLETAMLDLENQGKRVLFPSAFVDGSTGIPINGLIWMGSVDAMLAQIAKKIEDGYSCLKMKIGAISFNDELSILKSIRKNYSATDLELRVDANGAFTESNVFNALDSLATLDIHSIEQPIKAGQFELMQRLCANTPIAIALDEELIGHFEEKQRFDLISFIKPQFLILKPGLLGGFELCDSWINLASKLNIGWWATSALEGNVGLNAIAQWVFAKNSKMLQGLGTGQLFHNNIASPLFIDKGYLFYHKNGSWEI